MEIEKHKFFDRDVAFVQVTETTIELDLANGAEAVLLNSDDVKAMAIHFGIIQG